MAPQVLNDFMALVCAHPVISGAILILFTPPFFPIVKFFSPLLISTALFMLALFTMGPKKNSTSQDEDEDEDWTLRADGDGEKVSKRLKPDGSWKDWVKSIEESSLSWMSSPRSSSKLHKNWKNDENVSILEEASWVKGIDFMQSEYGEDDGSGQADSTFMPSLMAPSDLFKVDSGLQSAADRSIYSDMELGEDAPELEDVVEPVAESVGEPAGPATLNDQQLPGESIQSSASVGVLHQPLETLQIPRRAVSDVTDSPSTDLDDESPAIDNSKRLMFANLKKSSSNVSYGLSDADTPAAGNLSLSGKLKQMEKLGEYLDNAEHAKKAGQDISEVSLPKPTTDEQVEDVKDQLESFVADGTASSQTEKNSVVEPSQAMPDNEVEQKSVVAPSQAMADNEVEQKSVVAPSQAMPDNEVEQKSVVEPSQAENEAEKSEKTAEKSKEIPDSKTSENVVLSDSESEMEIFPSADPAKMKLHPPVKLDIEKLGYSLSLPQGEISEVTQ